MSIDEPKTNREWLICIDKKVKTLQTQFSNHLRHHWAVTLSLITISGGLVTALIISLLS